MKNQFSTIIAKRGKTPLIFDVHGIGFLEKKRSLRGLTLRLIEPLIYSFADLVLVTSEEAALTLSSTGFASTKIGVVTNGVEINEIFRLDESARINIRNALKIKDYFVIVSINPPEPANEKALELLKLTAKALEKNKKILFIVIGNEGNPNKNVRYLGFVKELNYFLNAADAAILSYPDNAWRTGPLNKTLQFMACGLPIISTTNGIKGISGLKDGVHYLHAQPNVKDLVEKINILRDNAILRQRIGTNVMRLILDHYTWQHQAKKLSDLFTNLC